MREEMETSGCQYESIIAASLANGELPENLRVHLTGCAVCAEVHSVAGRMLQFADGLAEELAEEPRPSAASMWWRLNLLMRQEKARRAQMPLVWMGRICCAAIAIVTGLLVATMPGPVRPAATVGLLALGAVALPVAIALWGWSRSKI